MNRTPKISVVVIALAVLVFLGVLTGRPMLDLISGSTELTTDMTLEQAENTYVSYDVTHPVTTYVEEYFSGDPDRVNLTAYVVYDEERQTFVKVVVSSRDNSRMSSLLQKAGMSPSENASSVKPVTVKGTLTPLTDPAAIDTLLESMYNSDSKSTEEMDASAAAQSGWYELRNGYVDGIPTWEIWIAVVVTGMNLLFLLLAVILLLGKGVNPDFLNNRYMGEFLRKQLPWLEPWCQKRSARQIRTACIILPGAIIAAFALGTATGRDISDTLTALVPLFLGIGEFMSLTMLLSTGASFNPYKLLKSYCKEFEALYPVQSERETVIQDLLKADNSWMVHEEGKEECSHGILGSRYWIIFRWSGHLNLVDSSRIGKMYSEVDSGQIRTGKVRYNYVHYMICIHDLGNEEKKRPDRELLWGSETASGHFMTLARKRLGDRAQTIIQ